MEQTVRGSTSQLAHSLAQQPPGSRDLALQAYIRRVARRCSPRETCIAPNACSLPPQARCSPTRPQTPRKASSSPAMLSQRWMDILDARADGAIALADAQDQLVGGALVDGVRGGGRRGSGGGGVRGVVELVGGVAQGHGGVEVVEGAVEVGGGGAGEVEDVVFGDGGQVVRDRGEGDL